MTHSASRLKAVVYSFTGYDKFTLTSYYTIIIGANVQRSDIVLPTDAAEVANDERVCGATQQYCGPASGLLFTHISVCRCPLTACNLCRIKFEFVVY